MSDYAGLVADPSLLVSKVRLLKECRLSSFSFTQLDEAQLRHGLEGEKPEIGLRINVADGAPAYWQRLNERDKGFMADTLRRARKIGEAHGPLRFTFQEAPTDRALDRLISAKRAQYARTHVPDALAKSWKQSLLHELARTDQQACKGVLSTLHAGDVCLAAHFGLMGYGVLHYWFPVYNPELARYSPGRLLMMHMIDAAAANGITVIDRGAGDSWAKRAFSNDSHMFYRGVWELPTPRAWCARAAASLARRYRDARGRLSSSKQIG